MNFRDIIELFKSKPHRYCYKIDYDIKTVTEIELQEGEDAPEDAVPYFPYEVLHFDTPYDLLFDEQWKVIDAEGNVIVADEEGIIS